LDAPEPARLRFYLARPPTANTFFIQRGGNDGVGSVYAGSLDGGEPKQIPPVRSNVAYSDGYLFYLKTTLLWASFSMPPGCASRASPRSSHSPSNITIRAGHQTHIGHAAR
jgi:hypothetical protein